jgi:hypothetical protein
MARVKQKLPTVSSDEVSNRLDNLVQQNLAGFESIAGGIESLAQSTNTTNRHLGDMVAAAELQLEMQENAERFAEEARREQSRLLGEGLISGSGTDSDALLKLNKSVSELSKSIDNDSAGEGFWASAIGAVGIGELAGASGGFLGKMKSALGFGTKAVTDATKVAGDVGKSATKASKLASNAGKFLKGANYAAAIAMNLKDAADIAMAGLDDDITTEVQNEDIGALIGGVIGGAIGVFGGPAGIALGASLGNTIGEGIGKQFDADSVAESAIESIRESDAKMQDKFDNIKALYEAGAIDGEEYEKRKSFLEAQNILLKENAGKYDTTQLLKEESMLAGEKYNNLVELLGKQEEQGIAMTEEQGRMLSDLENVYNGASKKYKDAVFKLEDQLNSSELYDKAKDTGLYEDNWGFGATDTIDRGMAKRTGLNELNAILEESDDLNEEDSKWLRDHIADRAKKGQINSITPDEMYVQDRSLNNVTSFDEGRAGKRTIPEQVSPSPQNLSPSAGNAGETINGKSKMIEGNKTSNINSITAPTTVSNNSNISSTNVTQIPPSSGKTQNRTYWNRTSF